MAPPFHFLVVDDLPTTRFMIVALLKRLGHTTVSEAEDGEQALKRLQSSEAPGTPVNFVITDWHMPVMDGLTLLRTIRASADLLHLPVLMITSEAESDNISAATQAGADGYLVKPALSAAIFKETLNKILVKRELVV